MTYLEDAGRAVRRSLRRGETVELAYTPGNGTLYPLVFLPVGADNGSLVAASGWMDHVARRSVFGQEHPHVETEDGWVLVSWLGNGAWLFRLAGDTPSVSAACYIAEKFRCGDADGAAIAMLFDVIAFGKLRSLAVA